MTAVAVAMPEENGRESFFVFRGASFPTVQRISVLKNPLVMIRPVVDYDDDESEFVVDEY